ncbi:MAG TPA: ABC transporter permease [Dinghuibacter sp.]|uniref:ABC transporter permease n=1 Tax=Dinghuibacter sp. TaxID=2024697 RepID=UPI002CDD5BE5|nr:ABC transporter permease [Dinghuibacter sp.]HTJ12489.1 ABC transporter permease [Dinghuibacter sp.]
MLKNYLTVAVRNLLRSAGFSFINVLGLSVGMASALLILLWVANEWTYDHGYPNDSRLYTVWNKDKWTNDTVCWPTTPKIMGAALKSSFPDIEQSSRMNWTQTLLFTVGDKHLNTKTTMVDPDFLTMFSVPFVEGNARSALSTPNSLVITQSLAKKLFGGEDALGKTVKLDNKDMFNVSGVIRDLPNNVSFDYEALTPWSYMKQRGDDDSSWGNNSCRNFVLLKPHASLEAMQKKIHNFTIQHENDGTTTQFLYPFSKAHLYGTFENGKQAGGKIDMVRAFLLIAIFILVIACINFMNLSTARSERRAKEVGIRKTVGALKESLVTQFLLESVLLSAAAGVVALGIVWACLGPFNTLTRKHLTLAVGEPVFWAFIVGFVLFTGLLAGSYPAFFLSSFRPVQVLKGAFKKANALVTPRKVLVVFQFTIAIMLIISTLIVLKQLRYAQERENGYDRSNLIYIPMQGEMQKNYTVIRDELQEKGVITEASMGSSPISQSWSNTWGINWQGKPPGDKTIINSYSTGGNIVRTMGMTLVAGRDIDMVNYPGDSTSVVLNESAVKAMGFKQPLGQVIGYPGYPFTVVGVVKDFIIESPFEPIRPMVIWGPKFTGFNTLHFKLNPAHTPSQNLKVMEGIFRKYNPAYPFEYNFVDTEYARKFEDEKSTATLAGLFAFLTIFISCLGLFGLAAYMAEARVKEIGVRKVLGASVMNLTTLLSRDFVLLVLISIVVAVPIAWYCMDRWLMGYKYRVHVDAWVFILSGVVAILISLITVSSQAIRAAMASPIRSLRSE